MADDHHVLFEDIVPYDVPSSLDALAGPKRGRVELPLVVYWGPPRTFDVDDESDRASMYRAVIRVGRPVDQEAFLNRDLLLRVWPTIWLPERCRSTWETAFPELRRTRQ